MDPRHLPAKDRFFRSEEGSLFTIGCCMLLLWLVTVAALWHARHRLWLGMTTMGFTHILGGRAASIAQATQMGIPPFLIATLATYFDAVTMFLVYPVLVFSYKNYVEHRFFRKHMQPVFEAARRYAGSLGRFKVIGVFLFVWFPFWMTGIISGSVLGFLIGLKLWVNVTVVVLGSAAAIVCWVYAYDKIFGWLGHVHRGIPIALSLLIIGGLIAARLFRAGKRRRKA